MILFRLQLIVVDVSSQSCTITPTSPDGLNPSGGVIVDGTVNVMIECRCVDKNGYVPRRIRWFDPSNERLLPESHVPDGDPYFIRNINRHTILVIPTFSYSTSGVYTCGIDNNYPPLGAVTINLMLPTGKKY